MQDFIDNFDATKTAALQKNEDAEHVIVGCLENISKNSKRQTKMPTQETFKKLQGDVDFKEKELENPSNTLDAMQKGQNKLAVTFTVT